MSPVIGLAPLLRSAAGPFGHGPPAAPPHEDRPSYQVYTIKYALLPAFPVSQLQDRIRTIASSPRLIVPGHDPKVFERFPNPGRGVAKIE